MKKKSKTTPAPTKKQAKSTKKIPHYTDTPFTDALEAFEQWKSGTPLRQIAKDRGFTRGVNKTFLFLAGGKDAFKALRAAGAGGHLAFGGKGGSGARTPVKQDESQLPRHSMKGWTARRVFKPVVVNIDKIGAVPWRRLLYTVMVSPKGNEYVEAKGNERADLIRPATRLVPKRDMQGNIIKDEFWVSNGMDIRYKRLKDSSIVKKEQREEALMKKGLKAQKVKKKAKAQKAALIEQHVKAAKEKDTPVKRKKVKAAKKQTRRASK